MSILGRSTCAESEILFRGGGGSRSDSQKTVWTTFFCCCFYSPELILQLTEGSNGFITEKTILFNGSRVGPEFSRGRGSNFFLMLISKETHITCDFPGDPDPLSPLWIRTCLRMRGRNPGGGGGGEIFATQKNIPFLYIYLKKRP